MLSFLLLFFCPTFTGHAVAHVHAIENIVPAREVTHDHRHQNAQIRAQGAQRAPDIMTHVFRNPRDAIHVAKVQDLNQ